jgi:hypothetical protein
MRGRLLHGDDPDAQHPRQVGQRADQLMRFVRENQFAQARRRLLHELAFDQSRSVLRFPAFDHEQFHNNVHIYDG